ncbi:abortive infection family protein [Acinetobacter sp. AS5]|uniref:abortive infection family protein n=1 Tax=Acinetobacter sp. AS5 TaxID=3029187 RepID=UPI003B7CD495
MADLIKKVSLLQELLIARALDKIEAGADDAFIQLRHEIISIRSLKTYIPTILKNSRSLDQFNEYLKNTFNSYADCKQFIYDEFNELFDILENTDSAPLDQLVINTIEYLNSNYIHQIWQKALERRTSDPEGAITIARSLLESTCKHILDEIGIDYGHAPEINQLYRLVSNELNLAPSQHTEKVFKQILGGCSSIVEGLGALRNKVGDAHGQGKVNVKPSSRHAELAVNLAGTMAVFLFTTWEFKKELLEKVTQK